jgi:hypothetical protein
MGRMIETRDPHGNPCCRTDSPTKLCQRCWNNFLHNQNEGQPMLKPQPMPTCNWEKVFEEQSRDPSGNFAWKRGVENAKAQSSLSDVSGGGDYPTGVNPTGSDGSQYHDQPITRVSDGTGKVARIIAALEDLDSDEAEELLDAIAARGDGRGVARLERVRGGTLPPAARDIGALRTPGSVYGGSGRPSWNTAADYLGYTRNLPGTVKLTDAQKADVLPQPNWDAAYEENASTRDDGSRM